MIADRSREGDSTRRPPGLLARRRARDRRMRRIDERRGGEWWCAPAAHEHDAARAVAAHGLTLRACRTATLELIKQLAGRLEPHRDRTLAPSRNGARRGRTRSVVRSLSCCGDGYSQPQRRSTSGGSSRSIQSSATRADDSSFDELILCVIIFLSEARRAPNCGIRGLRARSRFSSHRSSCRIFTK